MTATSRTTAKSRLGTASFSVTEPAHLELRASRGLIPNPSTRVLQRCPECSGTGIKKRKTMKPAYRCNDGHEFDEPLRENAPCTKYTAHFGGTFKAFFENFGRDFLRDGCPRYSDQLAMQEFEFMRMKLVFRTTFPNGADLIDRFVTGSYLSPAAAEVEAAPEAHEYVPAIGDECERVLRQIRARRGQQAFRDMLRTNSCRGRIQTVPWQSFVLCGRTPERASTHGT
jgi:hypothetical protein